MVEVVYWMGNGKVEVDGYWRTSTVMCAKHGSISLVEV